MSVVTMEARVLLTALKLVSHAAADTYERPILAAVLFEGDTEGFRLVAADNYQLAIADVELTSGEAAAWGRIVVPIGELKSVALLLARLGDRSVVVAADGHHVTFTGPDSSVRVRQVDGAYPAYSQILAAMSTETRSVAIDPRFLKEAARVARGATHVRLTIGSWCEPILFEAKDLGFREYIMPFRTVEDARAAEPVGDPADPGRPEAVA